MTTRLVFVVIVLFVASCVSVPDNSTGFKPTISLADLTGTYRNRGTGTATPRFLSQILWPNDTQLEHRSIEYITVRQTGERQLEVEAMANKTPVKRETFTLGKDFAITGGQIVLSSSVGFGEGPGDPLVGPRSETRSIGIDSQGHGKYRHTFSGAGLVLMLIPMALGSSENVRFERVSAGSAEGL